MISKDYIKAVMETYSCNIKKNNKCNKRYCICNNGPCERTTEFKYAKKTLENYLKRLCNLIINKKRNKQVGVGKKVQMT